MRTLSLDLDFFLDAVHLWGGEGRLDAATYKPWPKEEVVRFLEEQCGLSKVNPAPGRFTTHHDGCFHYWREMIDNSCLTVPFDVVHADAHADLGIGDDSYEEIMGKLLHLPVGERAARITKLGEGNFLAYAAACRWTASITHVTPPAWKGRDANFLHFRDYDERTGLLEMKRVNMEHLRRKMARHDYLVHVEETEPTIPYHVISSADYKNQAPFDFIFLCQSPEYTPETADQLLPLIRRYMNEKTWHFSRFC